MTDTTPNHATATLELDGRELRVPMDFEELSLLAQVFSVRTRDARTFLKDTPLRPAELWPGTSAVALLFAQYRRSPLDTYDEAIVSMPALVPGERAVHFLDGVGIALGRTAHYVHAMPVTQSLTMRAGRALWGYPKVIADIEVDVSGETARASLVHEGLPVFSMRAPLSNTGRFTRHITNLTLLDGVLRRVRARFTGEGTAFQLGGEPPQIGDAHPLALSLRALGLPKRPLASMSVRNASARFQVAEVLG